MLKSIQDRIYKSVLIRLFAQPFRRFHFQNTSYKYSCHGYNTTYLNERAVELPIIWEIVQKYRGKDVLEIGNVLSHYYPTQHKVVDKYEVAPGVINKDIVKFTSPKKFKLIVSISTIEHVGWDELPKSKTKIPAAIKKIKSLLAPGGVAWITLPLGYNLYMDELLRKGKIHFDETTYFRRVSTFNSWKEVSEKVLKSKPKYGSPFPFANVVVLGTIKK